MKEETIAALVGAALGAFVTWVISQTTNQVQKQIADSNAMLQNSIATSNLTLQKEIAESNAQLQRDLTRENSHSQQRALIDQMLLKIAEFGMLYPTVEKEAYCAQYPNMSGDANGKERYEHFCTYVFNVLNLIFHHCDCDAAKVAEIVLADEIVRRHHRWWRGDKDNRDYEDPFQAFIDAILRRLDKEGKLT
jgi:hypothetical protein